MLDSSIDKASGAVMNIVGGPGLSMQEVARAANVIYANIDSDANVILGALIDESIPNGTVFVTGTFYVVNILCVLLSFVLHISLQFSNIKLCYSCHHWPK